MTRALLAALLVLASCASGPPPHARDQHGCLTEPYECSDLCSRPEVLSRCPAWIGSDLTKPGVCEESCRGIGKELLHCRLYAPTCADAYACYSMLQ